MKKKIFEWRFEGKNGMGLFLAREILSFTGITITETVVAGKGARFEMVVPKGAYRFSGPFLQLKKNDGYLWGRKWLKPRFNPLEWGDLGPDR